MFAFMFIGITIIDFCCPYDAIQNGRRYFAKSHIIHFVDGVFHVLVVHSLIFLCVNRKQWRRQGLESTFCKEDADVSAGEGLPTVEERDEEETGNDQLPTVSYFGSGNSATASVNTAGMKDRCNKPMDGWTLKRKIKKTSATSTSDVDEEIDDPAYSDHMTPLVLAAQLGRYELIKMLMENVSPDIHPISREWILSMVYPQWLFY